MPLPIAGLLGGAARLAPKLLDKAAPLAGKTMGAMPNASGLGGRAMSTLKNPFSNVSVPGAGSGSSTIQALRNRMSGGGGVMNAVKDMATSGGPLGMIKNMATDAISGGAADLISMSPFGKPLEKLASAVAPVTGLAEKAVGLASNVMPELAPLDVGLKTVNDLADKA